MLSLYFVRSVVFDDHSVNMLPDVKLSVLMLSMLIMMVGNNGSNNKSSLT